MTDKEIDRLWGIAMTESIKAGEMFTRYRFAAIVAELEREACAQVCERRAALRCAAAIRERQ